jgi:hypothetical protein
LCGITGMEKDVCMYLYGMYVCICTIIQDIAARATVLSLMEPNYPACRQGSGT